MNRSYSPHDHNHIETVSPNMIPSNPSKAFIAANPHLYGAQAAPVQELVQPDCIPKKLGRGYMNKTERRFAEFLDVLVEQGTFSGYAYEGLTFRWGRDPQTRKAMRYTPDFVVFHRDHDRSFRLVEVKGTFIRDRDLVRFRGCRAEWDGLRFELWQWKDQKWTRLE